jgi:hypothetical protein
MVKLLPSPIWPAPAVFTDVGDFTLLVFTQNGVPTWEVRIVIGRDDLLADSTADTFEAAKAAALLEASGRSPE